MYLKPKRSELDWQSVINGINRMNRQNFRQNFGSAADANQIMDETKNGLLTMAVIILVGMVLAWKLILSA